MKHFRPLAVMLMSAILAAGTAAAADGKFGADRHAAMGLTCDLPRPRQGQSCHARHQDVHAVPQHEGPR